MNPVDEKFHHKGASLPPSIKSGEGELIWVGTAWGLPDKGRDASSGETQIEEQKGRRKRRSCGCDFTTGCGDERRHTSPFTQRNLPRRRDASPLLWRKTSRIIEPNRTGGHRNSELEKREYWRPRPSMSSGHRTLKALKIREWESASAMPFVGQNLQP